VTSQDVHDPADKTEDPPVSAHLLPPLLGLFGIGVLACVVWALGFNDNHSGEELSRCLAITDGPARLACYDQLTAPHEPARGALAPLRTHPSEESR
jgi:hypothetical protein